MVRAVFMMATRNDFERADIDKLEKMMKTLIQRWLRQNDTEDDVSFFSVLIFLNSFSKFSFKFRNFDCFTKVVLKHIQIWIDNRMTDAMCIRVIYQSLDFSVRLIRIEMFNVITKFTLMRSFMSSNFDKVKLIDSR